MRKRTRDRPPSFVVDTYVTNLDRCPKCGRPHETNWIVIDSRQVWIDWCDDCLRDPALAAERDAREGPHARHGAVVHISTD